MLAVSILVSLFALACLHYYFNYILVRRKFNLDGPMPWPFVGNLITMARMDGVTFSKECLKKYGRIYIVFFGTAPMICVSDREVARNILIRDFKTFPNRPPLEAFMDKNFQNNLVNLLRDDAWRRVRALITPSFAPAKMKSIYSMLDASGDELIGRINDHFDVEKQQDSASTKVVLKTSSTLLLLSIDAISSCAYGMYVGRRVGESKPDAMAKRHLLASSLTGLFTFDFVSTFLACTLPPFMHLLLLNKKKSKQVELIKSIMRPMIEKRRKESNNSKYNDFLQTMINARLGDKFDASAGEDFKNYCENLSDSSSLNDKQKESMKCSVKKSSGDNSIADQLQSVASSGERKEQLSADEMFINVVGLLFAGTESTASSMTATIYSLAYNQTVQEKLYEELSKLAKAEITNDGKKVYRFDFEKLAACAYLDSVISETLRLFGPAPSEDRQSNAPYTIENYNVTIPAGGVVTLNLLAIHRDPEYWPEPDVFNPERFMNRNRNKILLGSYLPFGMGPRQCLGATFAMTEMKIALAKLLMNFKLSPKEGTSWPLMTKPGLGLPEFACSDVCVERRTPLYANL